MAQKIMMVDEPCTVTADQTHTGQIIANGNLVHNGTGKVGLYGATPVAARASTASFHSSSWVSASSNITVGSALAAWAAEVTATLVALGIWT
jgi:hypothetical protein